MVEINLGNARDKAKRRGGVRHRRRTVSLRSLKRERRSLPIVDDEGLEGPDESAPAARRDCRGGIRPCPWVSCRFHLYLDVNPNTGSIKLNFPDLEPWELKTSCALDVAEEGEGRSLEDLGRLMNVTRERARQIERGALAVISGVVGLERGGR